MPDKGPEPICLSLCEKELDGETPFLALSYVWGSPDITEPVMCNGKVLSAFSGVQQSQAQLAIRIWPNMCD
jgi:hypothetical protein